MAGKMVKTVMRHAIKGGAMGGVLLAGDEILKGRSDTIGNSSIGVIDKHSSLFNLQEIGGLGPFGLMLMCVLILPLLGLIGMLVKFSCSAMHSCYTIKQSHKSYRASIRPGFELPSHNTNCGPNTWEDENNDCRNIWMGIPHFPQDGNSKALLHPFTEDIQDTCGIKAITHDSARNLTKASPLSGDKEAIYSEPIFGRPARPTRGARVKGWWRR